MTHHQPSYYEGFAPRDFQPAWPSLWDRCQGAWCPSLGPTGLTLRDWSGWGRHGTLQNMNPATDWKVSGGKYALETDGTDGYIICPAPMTTGFAWSLSFWFSSSNVNTTPPGDGVMQWANALSSGSPFFLLTGDSRLLIDNAYQTNFQYFTADRWYHLSLSRFGGIWTVYLDGVARFTVNDGGTAAFQANAASLYFGNGFNGYANARFDDIRFYDRMLSPVEHQLLARRRGIAYERPPAMRTPALQPMRPVSKVYVGGSWQQAPVKVYSGGTWKNVEPKVYSGGEWK